jgi:UDP-glucose 4-epimerase
VKVIVTGGCGFIGSNLAEELIKEHYVVVIDDLSTGKIENIQNLQNNENFEFVKGSITDLNLLKQIFEGADCIFHQAAIPSVQRSVENPIATNEANIKGTLNVLIAARDCGVKKVVYASSSSVYGDTPELLKREDMKPNPLSPYAVSKLTGEYYCKVFSEIYGIKTVCLRYFNVYGPKQDPTSEYAAVIPRFINRVLNNQPPVIYGDGDQTRDFTFVGDVIKANILAMEKNVEGVFNIACGRKISINELANKIMEIMGVKLNPVYDNPRPGDVRHSLADISLARQKLGYVPEYNLEKGLEVTMRWFLTLRRN